MLSRADVERLANAVHGDWKTHMRERNAKSAVRKRRMLERKEHQESELDLELIVLLMLIRH